MLRDASSALWCCLMIKQCVSTFDRWRCEREVDHVGDHEQIIGHERTRWNENAAGKQLRDLRSQRSAQ
ncbi:hypothetical protein DEJ33_12890 [Curtobacterium sp. MCPF17_047]|nr:hypothetical protein DEJ24_12570 [Curtobacterium sp. MCPF17_001]PZF64007.1 hypothetical protein DEJ33_12890 [Curtobacterium sp. MCPF17_047]